jgi:hypothetical protein
LSKETEALCRNHLQWLHLAAKRRWQTRIPEEEVKKANGHRRAVLAAEERYRVSNWSMVKKSGQAHD